MNSPIAESIQPEIIQEKEPVRELRGWSSSSKSPGLLVALPAFNEELAIPKLLQRVCELLCDKDLRWQVVVVDDGSADRTVEMVRQFSEKYPVHVVSHARNSGLGAALSTCFREAVERCGENDCVAVMDADNTQPPELIPEMLQRIREGSDVVIASRFRKGARVVGVPLHRHLLSVGARCLFTIAFPIRGVRDYTCGFRVYRASVLKAAIDRYGDGFVSENGFSCMCDVLFKLRKLKVSFSEVPLVLRYDEKGGLSKMKVLRTIMQTFQLVGKRKFYGDGRETSGAVKK